MFTMETTCACSLATNRRRESAVNRMPRGFFGTEIFLATAWAAVSIRWMSFEVSLLTATQRPSGERTAVSGSVPNQIFFTFFEDAPSKTETAESVSSKNNGTVPAGLNERTHEPRASGRVEQPKA